MSLPTGKESENPYLTLPMTDAAMKAYFPCVFIVLMAVTESLCGRATDRQFSEKSTGYHTPSI